MNIAIISRGDASTGGAGRVATLLATGLYKAGAVVRHIIRIQHPLSYQGISRKQLRGVPGDILLRNAIGIDISGIRLIFSRIIDWADVVHFHDVSVAYGIRAAEWVNKRIPICITMHDFSTITGGCLFPKKCKRYYDGCGHCPQIGQSPLSLPFDLTRYYFKKHYKLLSSPNVTVISPSDFLEVEAKQGAARSAKIVRIDNPVDTEIFTPELRFEVRQELKLLDYHKAILFVASQIDDPRKGFLQFFEIYKQIAFKRPYWKLLLVGNFIKASNMAVAQNDYVHYLGSIVDSSVLSGIYAASDCTIISSVADNVPCIISESLSCGTPVVAMRIGGLTEMFKNGCHGIVIHDDNAVEWENALCALLEGQQDNRRTIIREYALARYGLKISINKHIELYGKTTLRQRKFEFISKCKTKLQ